jgi:hypothetical protein
MVSKNPPSGEFATQRTMPGNAKAGIQNSLLKNQSIKEKTWIQIDKFIPLHFQIQRIISPMFFQDQYPYLKRVERDQLHFLCDQEY